MRAGDRGVAVRVVGHRDLPDARLARCAVPVKGLEQVRVGCDRDGQVGLTLQAYGAWPCSSSKGKQRSEAMEKSNPDRSPIIVYPI